MLNDGIARAFAGGVAHTAAVPGVTTVVHFSTTVGMRERMSGNICRCGAYSNIADAMADVAGARA